MNRWYGAVIFSVAAVLLSLSTSVEMVAQPAQLERLWTGLVSTTPVSDIAVKDDAGYVVSERGLEIYDLRSSPTLRLHAVVPLIPRTDPRIRLADDTLLLVWDSDTGVSVYSVVDAFAPRFLTHVRLTGVYDVDARGTQLYAAWRNSETPVVRQVDWTQTDDQPKTTVIMWSVNGFRKVQVSGRYVYALGSGPDNDWITVARITDKGAAQSIGFFEPEWLFIQDFSAQDSVLFVVPSKKSLRDSPHQSVIEYGVHPGSSLSLTLWHEYPLPNDFEVESIQLDGGRFLLHVGREFVPGHSDHTLISLRVGSDDALEYRDTLNVGLMRESAGDYAVSGTSLFWRNHTGLYSGLIDHKEKLVRVGDSSIGVLCYDVDGIGRDRVFAVTTDTLFGMDFSDPANPVLLSRLPLRAEGVAMIDQDRLITYDSIITLIDVSDPRAPRVLDTLNLGKGRIVWEAEVRDSIIVLCCMKKGTVVLVMRDDQLHRACEIDAQSTDALWMDDGLLLTTLDTTTAVWERFSVFDSQFQWCSPERLVAWGKTGQAITHKGDTVVVATGNALVFSNTSSLPSVPTFLTAISQRSDAAGLAVIDSLFFTESVYADRDLYIWKSDELDLQSIGHWDGLATGRGRFFFDDSLALFSAGSSFGLEVFSLSVNTLGVFPSMHDHAPDVLMHVRPSVVRGSATVYVESRRSERVRLALFDIRGSKVRQYFMNSTVSGKCVLELDVVDLPSGVYWLRMESEGGRTATTSLHVVHPSAR